MMTYSLSMYYNVLGFGWKKVKKEWKPYYCPNLGYGIWLYIALWLDFTVLEYSKNKCEKTFLMVYEYFFTFLHRQRYTRLWRCLFL
jgi:hypothetical protein